MLVTVEGQYYLRVRMQCAWDKKHGKYLYPSRPVNLIQARRMAKDLTQSSQISVEILQVVDFNGNPVKR